ncbi:hypothetical protein K4F52_002803 [Lecanicillium sp. MT-2017a]|nr:hypothetical protein K4F52_002803 [Lecanicillium sp. MT-2017a]
MERWTCLTGVSLLSLMGFVALINYYWLLKNRMRLNRPPLEILYNGDAEVDIIAVHGLGADVDKAWTWKRGDILVNWLKDLHMLPSIVEKSRIMVYNYDSAWHANAPKTRLQLRGEALIHHIHSFRTGSADRPIIFIGHSLGGLVVEYGLVYAKSRPKFRYLVEQIVGCVFLGTPFRGSKTQGLAYFAAQMMFLARSHTGIIRDLSYDNTALGDALHNFCQLTKEFSIPVFCFFEGRPTDYGKKVGIPHVIVQMVGALKSYIRIVEQESACIKGQERMELQVDHIMLNKFPGPQDPSFMSIAGSIGEMHKNMVNVLESRKAGRKLAHFMVPFERNRSFVGRESILQPLLERADPYASSSYCQRTAVVGLGGVGKTQIALEVAFRICEKHADCSVFWVPAMDITSFENAYRDIGRKLNIKGIDKTDADIKQLVRVALGEESSGKWLLVVDNADDADLLVDETSSCLTQYFPSSRSGSILFTTRNLEVAVSLVDSRKDDIFRINEMSETEARQLLATDLTDVQMCDTKRTSELLEFLENLPLAIRQASAFMAKKQISTAKYLDFCQSSDDDFIELLSRDFGARDRYRTMKNPITATWLISFENMGRLDPLAADLLKFICFLAPKDIPRSLFPSANSLRTEEAVGTLKAFAFLAERDNGSSYDVHRLVQIAARNWLAAKGEWQIWSRKAFLRVYEEFPTPEHENREVWTGYLPHAENLLRLRTNRVEDENINGGEDEEIKRDLLSKVGKSFHNIGRFEEAQAMYSEALPLYEKALGRTDASTLTSLHNLGVVLASQGKYEEAEALLQEALTLKENVLGPEHPDTLASMHNLGFVLGSDGKYIEAEAMHRKAIALREKVLGREHPDTVASMNTLGLVLESQGKYEEAEAMHREAVFLHDKVLGHDNPNTIASMNGLGRVLVCQSKYEESEQLFHDLLHLSTKVRGHGHPGTLAIMSNFGLILGRRDKHEEAEAVHREALILYEKVLGPNHPDTLTNLNSLGLVLMSQGKYEEAEMIFQKVLGLLEQVLGHDHPNTLMSMGTLGLVLMSQAKYNAAEGIYRKALALKERMLGPDHPDTLMSMDSLGAALGRQGKYEEAAKVYRDTSKLLENMVGCDHPATLASLDSLQAMLEGQGNDRDAGYLSGIRWHYVQ